MILQVALIVVYCYRCHRAFQGCQGSWSGSRPLPRRELYKMTGLAHTLLFSYVHVFRQRCICAEDWVN